MKEIDLRKARNGVGIFAKKEFAKNEAIFEVKGTFISCDIDDDLDEKTRSNTFRFDKNWYLNPEGELGDFINHSCEPNSAVVKKGGKLFIMTAKYVDKDDEITIDYSTIIAPDDDWKMLCNCGFRNCRGRIGQFQDLPEETKQEYILSGMVPDYILF